MLNILEYESLAERLIEKCNQEFGKAEIPWPPEKTMGAIVKYINTQRESKGEKWIEEVEPKVESTQDLSIEDANNLFNKLLSPPSVITESQRKKIAVLRAKIELRLNELKIDWLVVQYNELEEVSRKKFLQQIGVANKSK
jgi:hypothetical protein